MNDAIYLSGEGSVDDETIQLPGWSIGPGGGIGEVEDPQRLAQLCAEFGV